MTNTNEPTTTCQICGRLIKLVRGNIAHHGFQRPGSGYQTSSCMGARELPFEVSCDVLRDHVAGVAKSVERQTAALAAPVESVFVLVARRYTRRGHDETRVEVTEATLADVLVQHPHMGDHNGARYCPLTWARLVENRRFEQERDLRNSTSYHREQAARLAKWVAPV